MQLLTLVTFPLYIFPTDGHTPFTKCLLLLTHPHSSILPSIFFTCLPSNHNFTYTRPHIYPNNLPKPNITSLTSSFNSSQLPASHTSTTSSQISFNLNPNSPSSFLKHPQYFISIQVFLNTAYPINIYVKSISIFYHHNSLPRILLISPYVTHFPFQGFTRV